MRNTLVALFALILAASAAFAGRDDPLLQKYAAEAKADSPAFAGFSSTRGRAFYNAKSAARSPALSCATCHTSDPRRAGRTRANKAIDPLSPDVTPARFTDAAKVEKWFRRNCDDVLGRPCTALEKGDFVTYVRSAR
jgi:hypothetical protein